MYTQVKQLGFLCFFLVFCTNLNAQTTRNILLEEFSGTWCGLCPQGFVFMDSILNNFDNIIPVSIHQGDPMTFPAGDDVGMEYTGGGVPAFLIDRYLFPDYGFVSIGPDYARLSEKVAERLTMEAPLSVSILNVDFDENTSMASVTIRADLHTDIDDTELRFNLYVVEDNVISDEPGYAQSSFFNFESGHPFEGLGASIANFDHRFVCRSMAGGAWGAVNSIPGENLKLGDSFQKTFNVPIANTWNLEKLSFIAVVQEYNDDEAKRQILNSEAITFNAALQTPTNNTELSTVKSEIISCYPNPVSGNARIEINLNKTQKIKISVVDELGRTVDIIRNEWLNQGMHTIWWNIENTKAALDSGVYFISLETEDKFQSQKITLIK